MYTLIMVDNMGASYETNMNYEVYTDACIAVEEFSKSLGNDAMFVIDLE